jgi:hypothetical protein
VLQTSPLKRNIVLRFTKGGGAQENKEEYIDRGERGESGQLNIERLLGLPCRFSFRVWMTGHLVELIMSHLPLDLLYLTTSLNDLAGEELYQVP